MALPENLHLEAVFIIGEAEDQSTEPAYKNINMKKLSKLLPLCKLSKLAHSGKALWKRNKRRIVKSLDFIQHVQKMFGCRCHTS